MLVLFCYYIIRRGSHAYAQNKQITYVSKLADLS
jgi:hypothetical protein